MLSSSFAFRRAVADGRHLLNEVTLTLADGTVHTLDGSALTMGGITASGATSKSGTFSVGAAVVGTAEITLANYGGEWDDADFTGAEAVVKVGYAFEDGTTEMLRKGMYGVEQPESYDSTITLELRDNMRLFERDYSEVTTTYPATLQTIVRDVCQTCGVTMLSASFPRDSQTVASRPSDDNTSCLDVLAWAAQMAGCFCDVDPWGRLRVRWYDTSAFESEDWLDGGTYDTDATPYSDGDVADGGWFHDGGDAAEGGGFAAPTWATVTAIRSLTVVTDDVVVTGVRVVAADQVMSDGTRGADGESYLYGTDGYVLEVSGNPLVTYGTAQSVATAIGPAIVGMRFRPLTVTSIGDPTIEPGDPLLVIDRRQRTYRSWATSLTWKAGGIQSISCDAETPARNRADSYSAITREIVQLRNGQRAEKSARENAISELARQLADSSGLYTTEQVQQDGSIIYYAHDKPTLAQSTIVWKFTANAFAWSTDGGETYPYGIDVTGNAILERIYTIGLDASYIDTGRLVVGDPQAPMLLVDMETGDVLINQQAYLGDTTVSDLLQDVASAGIDTIEYGTSASSATEPTTWGTTAPTSIAKGEWLWVKTTYKDGTSATTKAYAGEDGEDGTSVYVASSTKSGDTTTVVLSDGTTLTIVDGEDGTNGTNGLNGYVHTAWANSADGSADFSTTVSTNKLYLGVYTDNAQADSQSPSAYSWSLIKGADGADGSDGQDGADGIGIASVTPQYYLSTSSSSATGGSWSSTPPTWSANHYIWTRSLITWDTTPSTTSTTTEVYDAALTQANQQSAQAIADAADAAKVATNYLTFDSTNGLDVGYSGTNAKTRVNGNGVEVFDGNGDSALFAGISGSNSIVRVGKASDSGNVVMSSEGYVDVRNASTILAHFGYGQGHNYYDQTIYAPYYTLGTRKANSAVESYSLVEGYDNSATKFCAHAEGWENTASSDCAHAEGCDCTASHFAAHAEGESCTASGRTSHAEGTGCTASGKYSHAGGVNSKAVGQSSFAHGDTCEARRGGDVAFGYGTTADSSYTGISQFAIGDYNIVSTDKVFIVGCGHSDSDRRTALTVDIYGNTWIKGTLTQNSDRRLKEHRAYLGEDACDFIRALKPALYTKDGERHVGFYAQDVAEAEPDEWDTVTVTEQHTDESLDFDPLTLDYNALIAPLVAYAQQLEKRIDQQQQAIEILTKRLGALEGR